MKVSILMTRLSSILLLFILAITAKGQEVDSVDYVIYSTIINNHITSDTRSVVVIYETNKDEYYNPWYGDTINRQQVIMNWIRFFQTPFDSQTYALYNSFDRNKSLKKQLQNQFELSVEVFISDKNTLNKFFRKTGKNGWRKFYEKYPGSGGIFEFSDIHYSEDGTKAVVYYSFTKNGSNGRGDVLIFQKFDEEWIVIHEGNLWQN